MVENFRWTQTCKIQNWWISTNMKHNTCNMDIVVHIFFYLFLCPSTRRCGKEILGGSYLLLLAGEGQVASPFEGHRLMISSIDRGKINLLPRKLTWNLKMMVSERNLLFQGLLFRFRVGVSNSCALPVFLVRFLQDTKWTEQCLQWSCNICRTFNELSSICAFKTMQFPQMRVSNRFDAFGVWRLGTTWCRCISRCWEPQCPLFLHIKGASQMITAIMILILNIRICWQLLSSKMFLL